MKKSILPLLNYYEAVELKNKKLLTKTKVSKSQDM